MSNGQVIQHPMWPPGHGPNRPVHPGPEPIHRPPWHGGSWGWDCTCGCDPCVCDQQPCPPSWSQDAIRCWNEMQQFRKMVQDIVQQELAKGPTAITGVIDGSDAKPGEVGEFVKGQATVNYAAYPTDTQQTVSVMVVPPGDWDITGYVSFSTGVGPIEAQVLPVPTGLSNGMVSIFGIWTAGQTSIWLTLPPARGSFSVPTLLPFQVMIKQSVQSGLPAGVATVFTEARRMR